MVALNLLKAGMSLEQVVGCTALSLKLVQELASGMDKPKV